MKHDILIGRPCLEGTHRTEVGNFLVEIAEACMSPDSPLAGLIGNCYHVPIQRSPVEVARNQLVQVALERNCSFLFMIDDDQAVEPGFFVTATQHLMNNRPCAIGTPACTAGLDYKVCVFEGFGRPEHVSRHDAARRRGIERVAGIGCAAIGYNVDVFRKMPQPWFKTVFDAGHTQVLETEDCWCHRRMLHLGYDIFVDWDHWATHFKTQVIGRPEIMDRGVMDSSLAEEARAELRAIQKKASAIEAELKGANASLTTINQLVRPGFELRDSRFLVYDLASMLGRLRENTDNMKPLPNSTAHLDSNRQDFVDSPAEQ